MDAYVYQAGLYCNACAAAIMTKLKQGGETPANTSDESSYDSDDYPKGPFSNGGGEADCPQHCDGCGLFLENPLTADGYSYVKRAILEAIKRLPDEVLGVIQEWSDYYDLRYLTNIESCSYDFLEEAEGIPDAIPSLFSSSDEALEWSIRVEALRKYIGTLQMQIHARE